MSVLCSRFAIRGMERAAASRRLAARRPRSRTSAGYGTSRRLLSPKRPGNASARKAAIEQLHAKMDEVQSAAARVRSPGKIVENSRTEY